MKISSTFIIFVRPLYFHHGTKASACPLEAMSCGAAVISSNRRAYQKWWIGKTLYLTRKASMIWRPNFFTS